MDARGTGRGLDLGLRGLGPAIGDVVADRVVEKDGVLRHHPDRGPQGALRDLPQILPVDADRP